MAWKLMVKMAIERGIRFTTASDAHSHVQIGDKYDRLAEKVLAFGVTSIAVYERHRRELRPL